MGLLNMFKKKPEEAPGLQTDAPFASNELPPLPPPPRGMDLRSDLGIPKLPPPPRPFGAPPALPPLPQLPTEGLSKEGGLNDIPPLPKLPPMPKIEDLPTEEPELPPAPEEMEEQEEMHEPSTLPTPSLPPAPMVARGGRAKVFVKLNKYKEIINTVNGMQNKVNDLQTSIAQIKDIRVREEEILDKWSDLLKEAKAKIEEVHTKLPGPDEEF